MPWVKFSVLEFFQISGEVKRRKEFEENENKEGVSDQVTTGLSVLIYSTIHSNTELSKRYILSSVDSWPRGPMTQDEQSIIFDDYYFCGFQDTGRRGRE